MSVSLDPPFQTHSYTGAGVLPFIQEPFSAKKWFIVGADISRDARYHGLYSDFGGAPASAEETHLQCAAREMHEEIGDLIGSQTNIEAMLQNQTRSELVVVRTSTKIYYLYLLRLDYQREFWEHKTLPCQCLPCKFKVTAEKSSIKWLPDEVIYRQVFFSLKMSKPNYIPLRPAFITEIKYFPDYRAFVQAYLAKRKARCKSTGTEFPGSYHKRILTN